MFPAWVTSTRATRRCCPNRWGQRDHVRGPASADVTLGRVRRFRVPVLPRRLREHQGAAGAHARCPVRLSREPAQPPLSGRRAGRGGGGDRVRAGEVLGDARSPVRGHGWTLAPDVDRGGARRRPRRGGLRTRSGRRRVPAGGARAGGERLAQPRPFDADVLHQRRPFRRRARRARRRDRARPAARPAAARGVPRGPRAQHQIVPVGRSSRSARTRSSPIFRPTRTATIPGPARTI